jgi:hypothetical protein
MALIGSRQNAAIPVRHAIEVEKAREEPLAEHGTNRFTGALRRRDSVATSTRQDRSKAYLLRRLACAAPMALAAYERGEYRSVQQAAHQ